MKHQERVRQAGPIEGAVNLHGRNGLAIVLDCLDDIQRDIDCEDLLIGAFFDRPTSLTSASWALIARM